MYPLVQFPKIKIYVGPNGQLTAKTNIAPETTVEVVKVNDLVKDTNDGLPFGVPVTPYLLEQA